MKGNVMRTVFFMNAAFWICACTIWAGHSASAQNPFSSNQYTSSVLYVDVKDDNDRRISTGSAVVVQKKKSGSATMYTLATAKHVVYPNTQTNSKFSITVSKTDPLSYPKPSPNHKFVAQNETSPLDLSQCDVSPSKSPPSFCSYDIALFDITVYQPNLFKVLPFERALPQKNVAVTLSGFPFNLYVESQAKINEVLEIDGLDFEQYTGGETIVTNKSVNPGHSGGGVLQKSRLVGIVTKSSSPFSMTRSVSVRQLCEIWGGNRLSVACTGFPNNATSTVSRVPSNIQNSNLTKSTKNPIKSIPQNHPAIVKITQNGNGSTVGYGVVFEKDRNNYYIATTANIAEGSPARTRLTTQRGIVLKNITMDNKYKNVSGITVLLASMNSPLDTATFCHDKKTRKQCFPYIPGKNLSVVDSTPIPPELLKASK